jgi:glycosyltransferase involved in cell wall biosynthesis
MIASSYGRSPNVWQAGNAPVAVIMLSLNEAHNLRHVLQNISGWAQEVFLVDSFSKDSTIDIALDYGVNVVQRSFRGFGDQWNFAIKKLPVTAPWIMKLDPDERLTDELKTSLLLRMTDGSLDGILVERRLWFMGQVLPVKQQMVRLWRTGNCIFTDVPVNEHPLVNGQLEKARGYLEHHDSPDLHHWLVKQNRYTTAEAVYQFKEGPLSVPPKIFGSPLGRRMWLKKNFWNIPGRYFLLFLYHFIFLGTYRVGRVGWIWSHLRVEVYRLWEFKFFEIRHLGRLPQDVPTECGSPDPRVSSFD